MALKVPNKGKRGPTAKRKCVTITVPQKHKIISRFYIHGSVHHYNCSKINTNKMTLMDYPLFHG